MHKQWLRTPSSQEICIFCATRLYCPPAPAPISYPLLPYRQRRALQSSARTRKPAEAAAALDDDREHNVDVLRPSSTPVHPSMRPTSLSWNDFVIDPRGQEAAGPARLSWNGQSGTITASSGVHFRGDLPGETPPSQDPQSGSSGSRAGEPIAKAVGAKESWSDPEGWAKYKPPKKLSEHNSVVLSQKIFAGETSISKKILRTSGRWQCECGASNYSRNTKCHYCRSPRDMSSIVAAVRKQKNSDALDRDNEESDLDAAQHWTHVRRGNKAVDAKNASGEQETTTDSNDVVSHAAGTDQIKQEREERLRASANGSFVGLAETQHASLPESQSRLNRLRRGRLITPHNAVDKNGALSKMAPTVIRKTLAANPSHSGWKDWTPPSSDTRRDKPDQNRAPSVIRFTNAQPSAPTPQTSEITATLSSDRGQQDVKTNLSDRPARLLIRRLASHASERPYRPEQIVENSWKNWDPMQTPMQIPVQPLKNSHTEDIKDSLLRKGFAEHKPAGRVADWAVARQRFGSEMATDKSRIEDRGRARRYQQRSNDLDDEDEAVLARIERKRQRKKEKSSQSSSGQSTPIILPEYISVGNLAAVLRVRIEDFVRQMKALGFEEMNNDHVLDAETAGLIATEFNFEPVVDRRNGEDLVPLPPPEDKSYLLQRPPVITIMGHVDHGKTTLLDWLRKSSIAASEHGGITQHIGAFTVPMPSGQIITFLDTPGHAAFLSMRQRGANVTDIVILVVAADDSVKPQTIEAISHAKAAQVPMIVAVNKIDKPDADVARVKQDLSRHGVEIEDFGGDTQVVCVSGKTGQGMEELEDSAVALADILDLRAPTDGQAEGWILEATTRRAGRVATVLVRRGTIVPGSVVVAGTTWARVRTLRNEAGQTIPSAGPGTPVEIDGWREQPEAGDEVLQAPNEQRAKGVVELRLARVEAAKLAADVAAVNESRRLEQEKRDRGEVAVKGDTMVIQEAVAPTAAKRVIEIPFIVRGDVSGSVEAVVDSISALGNSEIRPTILRSAVGPIAPTDVEHAAAAKGHIISFNAPVDGTIRRMAEATGVSILDQNIIYRLVDDVKVKLEEALPDLITIRVVGEADIAQVFDINIRGRVTVPIAGCRVRNGVISKGPKVKIMRDGEIVYDGSLSSLKNIKKDITEMRKGGECGMSFEDFADFKIGDQIQCYEEVREKRKL